MTAVYEYRCPHHGDFQWNHELDRCPGYVLGIPCKEQIKRIGVGSRKEKASAR